MAAILHVNDYYYDLSHASKIKNEIFCIPGNTLHFLHSRIAN